MLVTMMIESLNFFQFFILSFVDVTVFFFAFDCTFYLYTKLLRRCWPDRRLVGEFCRISLPSFLPFASSRLSGSDYAAKIAAAPRKEYHTWNFGSWKKRKKQLDCKLTLFLLRFIFYVPFLIYFIVLSLCLRRTFRGCCGLSSGSALFS